MSGALMFDSRTPGPQQAAVRLGERCRQCYQCGQCTSACPNGWELDRGPRQVVRLVLAGDVSTLLSCDDVWRCSDCGVCTQECPMEVPVHEIMASVRLLQLRYGGPRCPERAAAETAARQLDRGGRIDNVVFGAAMVTRGFIPKDALGAAGQGAASARSRLGRAVTGKTATRPKGRPTSAASGHPACAPSPAGSPVRAAGPAADCLPFFTGCALPQDAGTHSLTDAVAGHLGVSLAELRAAGCCGHPARGVRRPKLRLDGPLVTVCPACDVSLSEAGVETVPLWDVLTERARRDRRRLRAAGPAFVPYVGCLADRDRGLDLLRSSADLAGATALLDHPALHSVCCGAVGAVFRGETAGSQRLLAFAADRHAPLVATCLLCRDTLRSAARRLGTPVRVYLWSEFFAADHRQEDE